jgi:hypothetical protein
VDFERARANIRRLEAQIENHEARNATDAMILVAHPLGWTKLEMDEPNHERIERMPALRCVVSSAS